MAVSMKNVDVAFQGVGQKPYPTISGVSFLDVLLNVILVALSIISHKDIVFFSRVSFVGFVNYVRHNPSINCFL